MAYNKIIYKDSTLIDLTGDTVTPSTLQEGITAHDKSGTLITGEIPAVEFNKFYGLENKNTEINKDNDGNLISIIESSDEMIATTTQTTIDSITTITTLLVLTDSAWKYTKTVIINKSDLKTQIIESYTKELK